MKHRIPFIFTLSVTAALAGCAVGPDYQHLTPAQAAPEQFHDARSPAGPAQVTQAEAWWTVFHDAALNALVQSALQHSPDIESAEASVRQSRASIVQVQSAGSVQVSAEGRVGLDQFSRDSENFANIPFANPQTGFTDYRAGFDASWEIDLFGHTSRAVEAAWARAGGVEAQRDDVALTVAAETARNVLDYRYLQARLRSARAVVADSREIARLVRLQAGVGLASDIDVQQADIAVQNAEAALPPLDVAAQAAGLALVPLTGMTRDAIVAQLDGSAGEPVLPEARRFAIDSLLLERRPDIRIAERKLAASSADVGVAMADRYPRFTLLGDAGWDSVHPGQFGQQASRFWNVGPQVYVPILNGGLVRAQIDQSQAARDAALSAYRKAVLAALADTESALLRCQGNHAQLVRVDNAQALQAQQVALVTKRVAVGEAAQMDMLNARMQLEGFTAQQLATRQLLAEDLVLLFKALGGAALTQDNTTQTAASP